MSELIRLSSNDVTLLKQKGKAPAMIQKALGHRHITTTARYLSVAIAEPADALEEIPNLENPLSKSDSIYFPYNIFCLEYKWDILNRLFFQNLYN